MSSDSQPLIHHSRSRSPTRSQRSTDQYGDTRIPTLSSSRSSLRTFLSSSAQHYIVLALVSLDLLGIFADIIINLYQCDSRTPTSPIWNDVRNGLGIAGLVFSCFFMVELLLSTWAFGFRYFTTPFHILDTLVILASFTIDVVLHGVLEEVASLVVILRLWRFFKIIEEFSLGAEERLEALSTKLEDLERENNGLKSELKTLRRGDEEQAGWAGDGVLVDE